jgi:large subunit ribosomal protein L15
MRLHEILAKAGKHKRLFRVGRGTGSGNGKTSGRGHKGAKSRSGYKHRFSHEGGQMPLVRRVAKRGFSNDNFRARFDIVNVGVLEALFQAGETVDLKTLETRGVLKSRHGRLKVLGEGDLSKRLTVHAVKVSAQARTKVENAGGSIVEEASTGNS